MKPLGYAYGSQGYEQSNKLVRLGPNHSTVMDHHHDRYGADSDTAMVVFMSDNLNAARGIILAVALGKEINT